MNISEIKDLMAQFDASSLREFSYKTSEGELLFSKNKYQAPKEPAPQAPALVASSVVTTEMPSMEPAKPSTPKPEVAEGEGDVVESPLVGVAYLAPAPDKPAFVSVGDSVKKGQTLLIIEAMKVMNEVPAPCDGVVTEILVSNEEVVDFGKGLVRIK